VFTIAAISGAGTQELVYKAMEYLEAESREPQDPAE
jgi:hypothetical protein